jgi:hypothetical protein
MTQVADDVIILPDPFHNSHQIHIYRSRMVRISVVKKIGKMKTCFFPNQNFHNQKYYSKNGSKNLRGIEMVTIRVITPKNAEFSSLNIFGHHEIDLYPTSAKTPHFQYSGFGRPKL